MSPTEKKAAFSIALIYATRMLGLFLILPIFAIAAEHYQDVTPWLIGIAVGAYGLTQAIFQIPLGTLSDRIGRKKIILFGLILFVLGSLIAAFSSSIYGVIIGRALQGSGAIAGALLALSADLTKPQNRTKIMAIIGASIGAAFSLALILGPWLYVKLGIAGIFMLTATMALLAIFILVFLIPEEPKRKMPTQQKFSKTLRTIIQHPQLMRLNFGIFALHAIITAFFLVLPKQLTTLLPEIELHSLFYLAVFFFSFIIMLPVMLWSERKQQVKLSFTASILVLGILLLTFTQLNHSLYQLSIFCLVFFTCFNFLEANLPSLVSKCAPAEFKGTALGVYSTCQFFGAFIGGFCGGYLLEHFAFYSVLVFCGALALLWYLIAITMPYQLNQWSKTWPVEESTKSS